jgi:succinate-semialdehyde dehydrogenase/glutarate-semialdehyde dehydrogenase
MIRSHLLPHFEGFIAGRWRQTRERLAVTNPFDGEILAEVPSMGGSEALSAVRAAAATLETPLPVERRRALLQDLAAMVRAERSEIGRIITLENGKPLSEGIAEAEYGAGFYEFAARNLHRLESRTLSERPRDHVWTVHYRPAGVAGLITPWNFPFAMVAKKLAAAMAAGAPSVIKPAEKTPLSMIALFTMLERIEAPPGFVNLVIGDAEQIGRVFCTHPAVRVISFTGSTEVGKILLAQSAPHCKRVTLELGGNAPFLVFEDADLNRAADHLVQNKLRAGGQTCVCANRILVQRSVADAFERALVEQLQPLRVGNGLDEGVAVGPMIDRAGHDKVNRHLEDALARGARAVFRGDLPSVSSQAGMKVRTGGWFFPPTVVRGARPGMLCAREETFGPLFPFFEFEDEEEAVRMANDTEFGLAAYLFTEDGARAERVIPRLCYGHVGHNTGTGPTPEAPFGGMKESGLGREGGLEGLLDFVEIQTVPRG